jgi:hypothetical protein
MEQIKQGIDSLRNNVRGGGFSSEVFGNRWGTVNPMKAYEEYRAQFNNMGSRSITGIDTSVGSTAFKGADAIAKKYGAARLLTESEYTALKDLGYTSSNFFQKAGSYNNFKNSIDDQINDLAHNTAIYNINGKEANSRLTDRILQNADLYGENNSDATLVREFEKGKEKGNVSPKKLREDLEKGAQFTLGLNKDHGLVLTSSIGGKQYVIAPELISSEAKRYLDGIKNRIISSKQNYMNYYGKKTLTKAEEQQAESLAYQMAIRDIASSVGVDITQVVGQTSSSAE